MSDHKTTPTEVWVDPDDAPELTEEWFANAVVSRPGETPEELARRADEAHRKRSSKSETPKK